MVTYIATSKFLTSFLPSDYEKEILISVVLGSIVGTILTVVKKENIKLSSILYLSLFAVLLIGIYSSILNRPSINTIWAIIESLIAFGIATIFTHILSFFEIKIAKNLDK